jgi:RNA polymerase sigma factor (sigma-70 family)
VAIGREDVTVERFLAWWDEDPSRSATWWLKLARLQRAWVGERAGDRDVADDLLQDAWLALSASDAKALRRVRRPATPMWAWHRGLLRRLIAARQRRVFRLRRMAREYSVATSRYAMPPDLEGLPASSGRRELSSEEMAEMLSVTTKRQRDVLVPWLRGVPLKQIARSLQIAAPTARAHLRKALAAIRLDVLGA